MKLLSSLFFLVITTLAFGQPGIELNPNGAIFPRMTNSEMNGISGIQGQCIYNTTFNSIFCHNGSIWRNINTNNDTPFRIFDEDLDTGIETEFSADADELLFFAGKFDPVLKLDSQTLHFLDNGQSVFIGADAGKVDDLTLNQNVFIGYQSGQFNSAGESNVAIGNNTLSSNVSGNNNVAIGKDALEDNRYRDNVAIGVQAASSNTTGEKNVALGNGALANNRTGTRNVALGYQAGLGPANANPSNNVMIGYQAGFSEGGNNKLYIDNSGTSTPLIYGEFDTDKLQINGSLNIDGAYEFPIVDGSNGMVLTTDGNGVVSWENTSTGTQNAIYDTDGDTKIEVEATADEDIIRFDVKGVEVMYHDGKTLHTTANSSIYIGENAGLNLDQKSDNTVLGVQAGEGTGTASGNNNVFIGRRAGYRIDRGATNIAIGVDAGQFIGQGNRNVIMGYSAASNSTGSDNISLGTNAGSITSGSDNIFIGSSSGSLVDGRKNIFLGSDSGAFTDVDHQLYIGAGIDNWLVHGELDNKTFRVRGDLEIYPKAGPGNNSHLMMADSDGNMDEVIRRSGTDNTVVIGDVNNNGGSLHLRAAGATRMTVTPAGAVKYYPLNSPPGTCNTTYRGQVYYDNNDDKLKVCGKNGLGFFAWQNMH